MIEDGTGDGYSARVDLNHRVHARAVSVTEKHDSNENGNAYNLNSGVITLTTANDSAVYYMKNNEDQDFHVEAVIVGIGPTTGGSGGIPKVTIVKNPTTGTIISGATAGDINSNRNFASANTLDVTHYKGDGTAMTFTDGTDHIVSFQTTSGRLFLEIDEIIPKNKSIGVKVDPQAGNTSMDVYVAIVGHCRDSGI